MPSPTCRLTLRVGVKVPSRNLTVRFLDTVKPSKSRVEIFDSGQRGLVVRITPNGIKTFSAFYRVNGVSRNRRFTIGPYPEVSLANARQEAATIINQARKGIDPATVKKAERISRTDAPTFTELSNEYFERHGSRKKTYREQKRIVEKELIPEWGDRKAADINKRDVLDVTDAILDRGARISANRAFSLIRGIFNFGIERDIVYGNPCDRMRRPTETEPKRERFLSDDEIADFWERLDNAKLYQATAQALRMILVTAQRPGEVAGLRWDEIDMAEKTWTIPGARTKNGRTHRVPLSPAALEILFSMPKTHEYAFPSPRSGHIGTHALSSALRSNSFPNYTPHDLRRTASRNWQKMKIAKEVRDAIRNHTPQGVGGHYDVYQYDDEKREALNEWGKRLQLMVQPSTASNG